MFGVAHLISFYGNLSPDLLENTLYDMAGEPLDRFLKYFFNK